MRRFFLWSLLFACIGVCSYLGYLMTQPQEDIHAQTKESLVIYTENERVSEEKAPKVQEPQKNCFLWGPFKTNALKKAYGVLKAKGLDAKTAISERFESGCYVVFLGPTESLMGAKAFVKQFRQQGFTSAQLVERGPVTPGVIISRFKTEKAAMEFMTSKKAPRVKGIRIMKEEGALSDDVDIAVHNLTVEEIEFLKKVKTQFPRTTLEACPIQ